MSILKMGHRKTLGQLYPNKKMQFLCKINASSEVSQKGWLMTSIFIIVRTIQEWICKEFLKRIV